jgi:hypothetical protein
MVITTSLNLSDMTQNIVLLASTSLLWPQKCQGK